MSYRVHLQQFEGPLGLLLYLIRKEEMDIFDINIGEITRQYLEYIRLMKELDLEVAGEFVAMAATLIHIKSRMLLPQYNEEGEIIEQEDPRKELVQKLLDYQKFQEAAKQLYERPLVGRDVFLRGLRENFRDEELGEIIVEGEGLFSLISAYRRAMRKAERLVHKVRPKVQSIASRIMEIKERLIVGTRVLLRDLATIGTTGEARTRLLVTFLSILELGRMGFVSLFQNEPFGDIHIETKKAIETNVLERVQEFDAGDTEAIARSIIEEAAELAAEQNPFGDNVDSDANPQLSLVAASDENLEEGEDSYVEMATDEEILAAEAEIEAAERNAALEAGTVAQTDDVPAVNGSDSIDDLIDGDSQDGSLEA